MRAVWFSVNRESRFRFQRRLLLLAFRRLRSQQPHLLLHRWCLRLRLQQMQQRLCQWNLKLSVETSVLRASPPKAVQQALLLLLRRRHLSGRQVETSSRSVQQVVASTWVRLRRSRESQTAWKAPTKSRKKKPSKKTMKKKKKAVLVRKSQPHRPHQRSQSKQASKPTANSLRQRPRALQFQRTHDARKAAR